MIQTDLGNENILLAIVRDQVGGAFCRQVDGSGNVNGVYLEFEYPGRFLREHVVIFHLVENRHDQLFGIHILDA